MLCIAVFCVACIPLKDEDKIEGANDKLSTWVADWDYKSGFVDVAHMEGLASVQLFSVYFTQQAEFHLTEAFLAMEKQAFEQELIGVPKYFTVVNDRFLESGKVKQKDPTLISQVVQDKTTRARYITELVNLAVERNYDGVEMDFEKINAKDKTKVAYFYGELYQALQAEGKALRVLIEPATIATKTRYPEGPTYVVMAYNLHGYHSKPGPKADYAFIKQLVADSKNVPGKVTIAFATGGFVWKGDTVKALSEIEAERIAPKRSKRDQQSGALHFDSERHGEVWYSDAKAINGWIDVAQQTKSVDIAIWRAGGLTEKTAKAIMQHN